MTVEITFSGIASFVYVVVVLFIFSKMDLKDRHVPNQLMGAGMGIGIVLALLTGHLIEQLVLHIMAIVLSLLIGAVLFRLKAIGGADAKSVLLIACISPGIEFGAYENLVLEASIGCLIPVLLMLILGYVYYKKKPENDTRTTPLIPFLLIGFVVVQLFALI